MFLLKQVKGKPSWWGALQVQMTNSFFYLSLYNTMALTITVWYTAGHEIAQKYAPWFNFWLFLAFGFVGWCLLMFVDYKFLLPARTGFINLQSCKHQNPAMEALERLEADVLKIKQRLAIGK